MKIALINENSQAAKNSQIEAALKKVVEPMGHTVDNYGMYSATDDVQLTYVQAGILAAILLNSGAADYVVTGCGTGEGAMLAWQQLSRRSVRPCGRPRGCLHLCSSQRRQLRCHAVCQRLRLGHGAQLGICV